MKNNDSKKINILTSCDNGLARFILPQLASINESLHDYDVDFFLLHSRIAPENIQLLKDYSDTLSNLTFHEIVVSENEPYIELSKHGGSGGGGRLWPYEAYYWLCAHQFLPDDVDRVLCIDAGDIIINDNIDEYYFKDFNDKLLIATVTGLANRGGRADVFNERDIENLENLNRMRNSGSFCAGTMVLNITQFRARNITIKDFIITKDLLRGLFPGDEQLYHGDQGLAAVALAGKVEFFAYPEIIDIWYMPYNFGVWFFHRRDKLWYKPKIIHYNIRGCPKPWSVRFDLNEVSKYNFPVDFTGAYEPFTLKTPMIEFYEIWWKYCEMTPIYEELSLEAKIRTETLQGYYLPLCQKYNDLVATMNVILRRIHEKGLDKKILR